MLRWYQGVRLAVYQQDGTAYDLHVFAVVKVLRDQEREKTANDVLGDLFNRRVGAHENDTARLETSAEQACRARAHRPTDYDDLFRFETKTALALGLNCVLEDGYRIRLDLLV